MSGHFNQNKPAQNGWNVFIPQKAGGKFQAYQNQLVIIVPGVRTKKGKHAIYLTDEVMKRLQHPSFVQIMTRGQVIGIMKSATKENAYTVARTAKGDDGSNGSYFLNVSAFLKAINLKAGVYTAQWENGVLTIDTLQTPSVI